MKTICNRLTLRAKARALILLLLPSLLLPGMTAASNDPGNDQVITFITAPTHSKKQTREIYQPLVQYLSAQTGKKVELVLPRNFIDYTIKMRKGDFDLAFDGPHFVSWRIKRLNDKAIARLPGQIEMTVVLPENDEKIKTIDDLVGRPVCSFPSPNLLTMAFLDHFPNPIRQPVIIDSKNFKGMIACLKKERGKAMVMNRHVWKKMNLKGFKELNIEHRSFPTRTFTLSARIDEKTREAITKALLNPDANQHIGKLLSTFKRTNLVVARADEYNTLEGLLKPLWGFDIK